MSPFHSLFRLLPLLAGLSACVATNVPVVPCCYDGPVAVTWLEQVTITTTSGDTLSIAQALPGFKPQQGVIFTSTLPFKEVDSEFVVYASLEPLFPIYDANGTGTLETPEVQFLYLREALRGLGVKAEQMGNPEPFRALAIPAEEVGGLVNYVKAHQSRMTPQAQRIFADLELLGSDLLSKGSIGGSDKQGLDYSY